MAGATPANYRGILAHSKSRLGQTTNSVVEITERYGTRLESILVSLDHERSAALLTPKALVDPGQRAELMSYVLKEQQIASNALPQIEKSYDEMRGDLVAAVRDSSDRLQQAFLKGFDEMRPASEGLMQSYLATYLNGYRHLAAMLLILDENAGKFTVRQDGYGDLCSSSADRAV
jgi:hypothetical protein